VQAYGHPVKGKSASRSPQARYDQRARTPGSSVLAGHRGRTISAMTSRAAGQGNAGTGGHLRAIARDFPQLALARQAGCPVQVPAGLSFVSVDAKSGCAPVPAKAAGPSWKPSSRVTAPPGSLRRHRGDSEGRHFAARQQPGPLRTGPVPPRTAACIRSLIALECDCLCDFGATSDEVVFRPARQSEKVSRFDVEPCRRDQAVIGLLRGIFDVETSHRRLADLSKLAEDPIN